MLSCGSVTKLSTGFCGVVCVVIYRGDGDVGVVFCVPIKLQAGSKTQIRVMKNAINFFMLFQI